MQKWLSCFLGGLTCYIKYAGTMAKHIIELCIFLFFSFNLSMQYMQLMLPSVPVYSLVLKLWNSWLIWTYNINLEKIVLSKSPKENHIKVKMHFYQYLKT